MFLVQIFVLRPCYEILWQAFRSFENSDNSFGILIPSIGFLREIPFSFFVFQIWELNSVSLFSSDRLFEIFVFVFGQFVFSRSIPFSFAIRVVICGMIG